MEAIDGLCDLLQSHANRDKVVALTCYTLKLWGATVGSKPILTASARMAVARGCLRLFDDPAALRTTIKYGLGRHEGPFWGSLGVATNVFTLAYLQVEKLVFLLDTGIIKLSDDAVYRVRTAHKVFWSLFAFLGLVRSLRALHLTARMRQSPHRDKYTPARFNQASLVTTKLILDVIHAISWLPPGWLWGSKLSVKQASGIATVSAAIGLKIYFNGITLALAGSGKMK